MAVEPKRGCGYRKVGGLYLCADGQGRACCRLPIQLHICPTCNQGIKQTRGWTWLDIGPFTRLACEAPSGWCPLEKISGRIGLIWIGEQFYPTPAHFNLEAERHGISRRIKAIPRGFVIGETWVALAHPKLIAAEDGWRAGIFRLFQPTRIEKIVTESQFADTEAMDNYRKLGMTPVPVPDDDPDHRGTAYDKEAEEQ